MNSGKGYWEAQEGQGDACKNPTPISEINRSDLKDEQSQETYDEITNNPAYSAFINQIKYAPHEMKSQFAK